MKWWDWIPWSLFFKCWVSSQLFHSPLLPSSRGSLVPLCFLPLGWCHLHTWVYWYFSLQSWFQLMIHPAWHFTYEITQTIKTNNPVPWGFLPPEMAHTIYGMCMSLNKFVLSLWLVLEVLPVRNQGPSLGNPFPGLTWDLGSDHLLAPHFFPCKSIALAVFYCPNH